MKLTIATPMAVVVSATDVGYVRAEDDTGAFGILPGHADFLTTLSVSVVTWRENGEERHVAVRAGVLTVRGGDDVSIVTREAVGEETLSKLGNAVLDRLRHEEEEERAARLAGTRMELVAMRQIQRYLATGGNRLQPGRPAASSEDGAV
jgi:F-type H+-transporting ATPase subunit epsilon